MYRPEAKPGGEGDLIAKALIAAAANETIQVWPENWPAFALFASLCTQWRVSMNGPSGLDYLVLHRELDDLGLSGDERQQMKSDIREMERAALSAMRDD
jgi:hypothetical protein